MKVALAIGRWETHYNDLLVWPKINLTQCAIARHEQKTIKLQ